MLAGPNSSTAILSEIYASNNTAIALAMTRIASGKRVQGPSDDFAGYAKASNLQSVITRYETIKQDLQDTKGLADYAAQVGSAVVTSLDRLLDLKTLYDSYVALNTAEGNASAAATKASYDAAWQAMNDSADDSYFNSVKVYQAADLATVTINPIGTTIAINGVSVADMAAVKDITAISTTDITDQVNSAEVYAEHMKMFSSQMDSWTKFADTVINSNQATISVITDINDLEEMSLLTNLQLRQQATVAMMAQANMAQKYAEILYGGKM
jgi:flagellin-like hook-associated protein FlgL